MQLRRRMILLMIDFLELLLSRLINVLNFMPIKYFNLLQWLFLRFLFLVPFRQYVSSSLHIQFETTNVHIAMPLQKCTLYA